MRKRSAATLGVIYGYDGSNGAGAQHYCQDSFGLEDDDAAVETIVTATVYGELIGALAGGFIINRFGRKPSIVAVAFGYVVFCLASAFAVSPQMLGISRFLLGLTIGVPTRPSRCIWQGRFRIETEVCREALRAL